MNYNAIFDKYVFSPEKALTYGFELIDGNYVLKKPLQENGFYAVFCVSENDIEVNVYEDPDGELYLPYNTSADGGFVNRIRADAETILNKMVKECFVFADIKAQLLDYVFNKYGTVPESPWDYLEQYHTLNTAKRHKWYGLFMFIPYKYLGIEKEGKINVLNLKVKTEDISALIDNVHFFPAYHMNKKYWITILLDREVDIERIKTLLDDSYNIVESNKR